jgi:hypothetical protein
MIVLEIVKVIFSHILVHNLLMKMLTPNPEQRISC